jgi:ribonuclease HII
MHFICSNPSEPLIIDEINILNASIKAMQESILKLDPRPFTL